MILYHMTPEKNIKRISQEGLRPGSPRAFASKEERETVGEVVFLARDIDEARLQLDLLAGDEPGTRVRNWAIFEVSLPKGWPLEEDYEGYLYTTKSIPPEYLRLAVRDSTRRKQMLEAYGYDYN